jgi:hypothetical protein
MVTSVDQVTIRPYFNAGFLVVRPGRGLLRKWSDIFFGTYRLPAFTSFYEQNQLYEIFIHQAVLSGIILASLEQNDLLELPRYVNYPLHMQGDYPAEHRPQTLNELITCRYDPGFSDLELRELITIEEPLRSWLDELLEVREMKNNE